MCMHAYVCACVCVWLCECVIKLNESYFLPENVQGVWPEVWLPIRNTTNMPTRGQHASQHNESCSLYKADFPYHKTEQEHCYCSCNKWFTLSAPSTFQSKTLLFIVMTRSHILWLNNSQVQAHVNHGAGHSNDGIISNSWSHDSHVMYSPLQIVPCESWWQVSWVPNML